ncbi:MAG: hydantoinase/oxoprolinase N-terminal domain-containing protein, partial [Nitrosopumilaceae archaeon]
MRKSRRVRIGIDVGGTFTKAVGIDITTGNILAKSTVLTTHNNKTGVSGGIVDVFTKLLSDSSISLDEIELIAHSTTQAINALLESDTAKVGIIGMGVGPEKQNIIKRTNLQDYSVNSR